jgi:hypothetical protein
MDLGSMSAKMFYENVKANKKENSSFGDRTNGGCHSGGCAVDRTDVQYQLGILMPE